MSSKSGFEKIADLVAEFEGYAAHPDPEIRQVVFDFVKAEHFTGNIATGPSDELLRAIAKLRGLAKRGEKALTRERRGRMSAMPQTIPEEHTKLHHIFCRRDVPGEAHIGAA